MVEPNGNPSGIEIASDATSGSSRGRNFRLSPNFSNGNPTLRTIKNNNNIICYFRGSYNQKLER